MKDQCHDPGWHCCHKNNDQGVSKPFDPGTHIQLRKVYPACNKRKTRYNKKHGTNVSCLMLHWYPPCYFSDFQKSCIYKTCQCYWRYNSQKECKMMLCQLAPEKISKPRSGKSTEHFDWSSSKQKRKSPTCQRCCEPQCHRRIKAMNPLDLIQ